MTNTVTTTVQPSKKIWKLLSPFWQSEEKWPARLLLFSVVALALSLVFLNVLFNEWNRDFYNALETKNLPAFWAQLWRFSWLAFVYIAVAIYKIYLTQALDIRWRRWMTNQYMSLWLENQSYYRIEQTHSADNPDQRIAEDLKYLTSGSLSLSLGLLSSVVTLVSFIGILWSVSGPLTFMLREQEWRMPGYMVWFAIGYAGIGSLLVAFIGKPLVKQNVDQQRFEADFRFGLIRLRENAEPVALYHGEEHAQHQLSGQFARIRENWWAIMKTSKRLNITSTFYAQFAVIFPFLVGAPRYFSGVITLGGLMQISSAFGQVQSALSWFIDAYGQLAEWKASVNRLAGFHEAVSAAHEQKSEISVLHNNVGALLIEGLVLRLPNGTQVNTAFTSRVQNGQRILVTGPSGCGKSTLFRAIAGIWPYGSGSVEIPHKLRVLFVPQRSYLPIGTLRSALGYPSGEDAFKDLAIRHYLQSCRLDHLAPLLDTEDNWGQRLSPGEQQRIAFMRALLIKPDMLFLDEASSALDGETERALYQQLFDELPKTTVISIAHRAQVAEFHEHNWHFDPIQTVEGAAGPEAPPAYQIIQTRLHRTNGKAV
jgi:putative ATP-binding cassette transporter